MRLTVNGEVQEVAGGMSVRGLIEALDLDFRRLAVERNREIVPKSAFEKTSLEDGDVIEIVHFVGGG